MPENMKGSKSEKLEVVKARSRKARRKELEVGELSVKQLKVLKLEEEELNEGKARNTGCPRKNTLINFLD